MPIQADKWEDMLASIKKLNDAFKSVPAPPRPDDQVSQKMNELWRAVEGLTEQVRSRVQMEQEAEELHG